MGDIAIGDKVPDVALLVTGNRETSLHAYHGKSLVLYFYPKASTPGCTQEGRDFSAEIAKFRRQSCIVLGASRDSLKAQENFKTKQEFPFDLVADKDQILCTAFGVLKPKTMFGKQGFGIERSTFLIDAEGVLRQEWRGVKVKGHVEEVLKAVKSLAK